MQSKASTVAAYIKELPEPRRKAITALTALCRKVLVGFDEGMEYGMPYYKKDGLAVGIASQKNYISIYGLRKQVAAMGAKLDGAKEAKGCINFTKPEEIDLKVIERLLVAKRKAE
jgi:uncharacterized protein YdhG (YjbR/CyaY superfamily)